MIRELPEVVLGRETEREEVLGREIVERDPLERDEVEMLGRDVGRDTLGLETLGREVGRDTLGRDVGRDTLGRETLGREELEPRPRWASAGAEKATRAARVAVKAARMR